MYEFRISIYIDQRIKNVGLDYYFLNVERCINLGKISIKN